MLPGGLGLDANDRHAAGFAQLVFLRADGDVELDCPHADSALDFWLILL